MTPSTLIAIAEALAFSHQRGLVHRDVKPANILLDELDTARLSDFDLVHAMDTTGGTRTGALGTFMYAAPEALTDASRVDGRADIYSLSMVGIFLTQRRDLTAEAIRDAPSVISRLDASDDIKTVLQRGCAWNPDERFQSMLEFCEALRSCGKTIDSRHNTSTQPVETAGASRASLAGTARATTRGPRNTSSTKPSVIALVSVLIAVAGIVTLVNLALQADAPHAAEAAPTEPGAVTAVPVPHALPEPREGTEADPHGLAAGQANAPDAAVESALRREPGPEPTSRPSARLATPSKNEASQRVEPKKPGSSNPAQPEPATVPARPVDTPRLSAEPPTELDAQSTPPDPRTQAASDKYDEGMAAFDTKHFATAYAAFSQAYALQPHPAVLWSMAASAIGLGGYAEAATHLARFIAEDPTSEKLSEAKTSFEQVRARVALLSITLNVPDATIHVDGEEIGPAHRSGIFVMPGEHAIRATRGAASVEQTIRAQAGESISLIMPLPSK